MSVNSADLALSYNQASALLNQMVEQATGQSALAQINTGDFTSVATMALRNGYDPILNAVSQVLNKTIVSIRPYSARLKSLRVYDADRWGALTRKISFTDREVMDDERITPMVDGTEYSPYKVRKPIPIQVNISGADEYEDYTTIFKDQLDSAFTGVGQFNQFITGQLQNMADKKEQYDEAQTRACLLNLIGGTYACEKNNGERGRVRHLLTEFQAFRGDAEVLTIAELFGNNDNLIPFASWLSAELRTLVRKMSERTMLYHECPLDGSGNPYKLMRHTSPQYMTCYMLSEFFDKIDSLVRPGIFANDYLSYIDYEGVTYWQSIEDPAKVNLSVSYLKNAAGANDTAEDTFANDYVLGVLMDREAAGYRPLSTWSQATPMNPRKGFSTLWYHFRSQWMNDNTENCVVLLLD